MGRHSNKANPNRISRSTRLLLASPAAILFASAARLILICNYDTANAAAMASFGGIVPTLLGSIIPLLPPFLPLLTILLLLFRRWASAGLVALTTALISPAYESWREGWRRAFEQGRGLLEKASSFDFTLIWHQNYMVLVSAGIGVVFAFLFAIQGPDYDEYLTVWAAARVVQFLWGVLIAAACCLCLLFVQNVYRGLDLDNAAQVLRRPWMPAEQVTITTDEERRTYVGYVISTGDGWFEMLLDETRIIVYVRADTVVSRSVCVPPSAAGSIPDHKPLLDLRGMELPQPHPCDTGFLNTPPPVSPTGPKVGSGGGGHARSLTAQ